MFEDNPTTRAAAIKIQRAIRSFLERQNLSIKVTAVGKGITSFLYSMKKPSLLFGEAGSALDLHKKHEVMVTCINPKEVDLLLTTNQGTSDALMKHLKDCHAKYGAIINGGFYAINGFYDLATDAPIGLHRFAYNASVSKRLDIIKKDFDNTSGYSKHKPDALTACEEGYEKFTGIDSQLDLKTQVPHSVKDRYGLFRISQDGSIDLQKLTDFADDMAFQSYVDNAKYLMSSGPILVSDNEVTITSEDLETNPSFQFKQVYEHFGSHPGSVPPGTFYHADQLNPRSGIGITENGELLMVTVKGEEEPSKRDGMRLDQFALLMKLLGAKEALNLDGGYSSCQGIFNQSTMFKPLFIKKVGREKLVPYAIVAKEATTQSKDYNHQPFRGALGQMRSVRNISSHLKF